MKKPETILDRLIRSLFWAAMSFWSVIFIRMLLQNLAAQDNILARALLEIPVIPAAVLLAGIVFLWRFIKNGLFHFLLSLSLCAFGIYLLYGHTDELLSTLSRSLSTFSMLSNQYTQKDEPIYSGGELIASEPFPIYYIDDGDPQTGVSQELIDSLSGFVSILPEELLERPAALYLIENDAFEAGEFFDNDMEIFGFSSNATMSSSIRLITEVPWDRYTELKSGEGVYLNDERFYKETIIHELSHLMDMNASSALTNYSQDPLWLSLYRSQPDSISDYGSTDPAEFFAEAAIYYYMYPDLLIEKNPQVFDYFNRQFQQYN